MGAQPASVAADFRNRPDDPVDLARPQAAEQVVDVVGLGFEDEVQHDRVAALRCGPLDGRQHSRRAEVVEAVGDDAEDVAATLRQAAGQHVRRVSRLADDFLNTLERFGSNIGPVVEHARYGLRRDPGLGRHVSNGQAFP